MTTNEELEAAILTNAVGPQTVSVDGQTVTAHDIEKQIAALKVLGATAAMRTGASCVLFNQIKPPGAV